MLLQFRLLAAVVHGQTLGTRQWNRRELAAKSRINQSRRIVCDPWCVFTLLPPIATARLTFLRYAAALEPNFKKPIDSVLFSFSSTFLVRLRIFLYSSFLTAGINYAISSNSFRQSYSTTTAQSRFVG
jgi:hypothetical protein